MARMPLNLVMGVGLALIGCRVAPEPTDSTVATDVMSTSDTTDTGTVSVYCPGSAYCIDGELAQPTIGVRSASTLQVDGWSFKDSNGDGALDPYEDWRLPMHERVADLVGKMSTTQMIGLLYEGGLNVAPTDAAGTVSKAETEGIVNGDIRQSLLRWPDGLTAETIAIHLNELQALAEAQPLGIPMVITTDPVFAAASDMSSSQLTHQNRADQITDWPLMLGLAAINDEAYVENVARMQREQLASLGIRWMLGPQAELASEPMWSRVYDTFGARADRAGLLGAAYIRGFQGRPDGVDPLGGAAATLKHFPGGGPNEGGMDSHTEAGRFNVFPGGAFDTHLDVMRDVIDGSNPFAIMPNYSVFENLVYEGKSVEQLGASFSEVLMVDILRDDIGWDGFVTSDWGAVGYCFGPGNCASGSAWGTETWTNGERVAAYVSVGGHQIGNFFDARVQWEDALKSGDISEADVAFSAGRALELAFAVGAFENPYVDASAAQSTIEQYEDEAHDAMMRAFTLLQNDDAILPLDSNTVDQNGTAGIQVYFDGHDDAAIAAYAAAVNDFDVVSDPADADYAIVRISARHGNYFGLDGGVPLSFRDPVMVYDQTTNAPSSVLSKASSRSGDAAGNNAAAAAIADTLDAIVAAKEANPSLKIIIPVSMYRPFVIEPWLADIDVLAAEFGMSDAALLDMLFQMRDGVQDATLQPTGTLPMEIPSSQAAVYDALEDVPHDSANPSFEIGAGITTY